MMQQMATYASPNITTELIQRYLDENKQLILAILDNQSLGRLSECAQYQAKLQQNLMYLAAIADAQPHTPQLERNYMQAPPPSMQPAHQYLQQQQQQLMMSQRPSIPQYLQQSQQSSQQSFYSQQSLLSGGGGGGSMHMLSDRGIGGNGSQPTASYPDGANRDGNQMAMTLHGGNGTDLGGSSPLGQRDSLSGQGNDDSEASYLKGSDGSSL